MTLECFKEMPCTLKLCYILIALLLVLNIMNCVKIRKLTSEKSLNPKFSAYINDNPEVILESVNKYVMKQQEDMQQQQQAKAGENIAKYEAELKDTKYAGVINPKGTVDIVEFYDYNCSYCKLSARNIEELLKTRKDVRVILRAIPILSEASRYATEVGMAILIDNPSKYPSYHKAIMEGSARSKEDVAKAVDSIGLSMSKIEKIMTKNKSEIDQAIESNMSLARKIGINGTPAFIINGELIPGAIDVEALNQKAVKK